jgi:hypothetical protein
MSNTAVLEYLDSPADRVELTEFLKKTGDIRNNSATWEQRLSHWWDTNPFAKLHPARGWVARTEEGLVGFGGLIPVGYLLEGKPQPVLLATTWRVEHNNASAGITMFMRMRAFGRAYPVFHTTPIEKIQHALARMKAVAETSVQRRIFPTGLWRFLRPGKGWPQLSDGVRLTTDLADVQKLERPYQRRDRLEKWTTLESLRWYCAAPMRRHVFVGAVNQAGTLTSFLILTPRALRGVPTWDIVESFTTWDTSEEVQALAGELIRHPELLSPKFPLLTVASFASDTAWEGAPAWITLTQSVCHYFIMPAPLKDVPKLTMMAEGDLGL